MDFCDHWPDLCQMVTLGFKAGNSRDSLVVQWLGLRASTARGMDLIPGQGTKIPQAVQCGQKKKSWNSRMSIYPACTIEQDKGE